jgi:hypothetical protein
MSCQALKANLRSCRNWSCLDSDFCGQHKSLSPEVFKKRWIDRYVLGQQGQHQYTQWHKSMGETMLRDLESKRVTLTPADIAQIPSRDRYLDVYLLLVKHGYAKIDDNIHLLVRSYWYYIEKSDINYPDLSLRPEIRHTLILESGKSFFRFLVSLPKLSKSRQKFVTFAVQEIPTYMESSAAKELSWWCHKDLDELRIQYEKELSVDHPMTKCLTQRWLLDLKELYVTEKAIQKLKMDHCKEELMMNRWHPSRLEKYLNMGYEIDQLDDIM